jgi:hypothetical protein
MTPSPKTAVFSLNLAICSFQEREFVTAYSLFRKLCHPAFSLAKSRLEKYDFNLYKGFFMEKEDPNLPDPKTQKNLNCQIFHFSLEVTIGSSQGRRRIMVFSTFMSSM